MENGVFTCKCGALSNAHVSGLCRNCRQAYYTPQAKRRRAAAQSRAEKRAQRKPVHGSQEWAETMGDDLGESPDY